MIAIITGATGQDGSYLIELLLEKGYTDIRCAVRRTTYSIHKSNIKHLLDKVKIYDADLTDQSSLFHIFENIHEPFEVYNLAAQSQVGTSFTCPVSTFEINSVGTLNLLETIRKMNIVKFCKFYQASTSEMFGKVQEVPQTEKTAFYPRSPYGVSKMAAHWLVKNYRETYGLFACSGILFNHESPRRGEYFVTQKIVKGFQNVLDGNLDVLEVGNIESKRDWGHAKDYVRAMWMMLQQPHPGDYIVSSGELYSVKDFIEEVAKHHNVELVWNSNHREARDCKTGKLIVKVSEKFYRPCEVDILLGNPEKIRSIGWKQEYSFEKLVKDMVNS